MKTVLFVLAMTMATVSAYAGCSSYNLGSTTHTNCDNGYSASGYQLGNTYHVNDNQGGSTSCYYLGSTLHCN